MTDRKQIPDFPYYEIDTLGQVYNIKTELPLKCALSKEGIYVYCLTYHDKPISKAKQRTIARSRLLAATFLGLDLSDRKQLAIHLNGNKQDDTLDNIRITSFSDIMTKRHAQNKLNKCSNKQEQ